MSGDDKCQLSNPVDSLPLVSDNERNCEKLQELTIYYFPTSFSSQKVLLAAYVKGLSFKPRLVSLFHGHHMEPWYVRLNPEGTHIPVLVHGETILNDPETIIDYIDTLSNVTSLVPDLKTARGQAVHLLREQLNGVPVDIITYGVVFHPHLSPGGCRMPAAVQRSMQENFARRLQYLTHKATQHPNLRDGYLAKSQIAAQKYDVITDEEKVKGHLSQLDAMFWDIEKLLAISEGESDKSQVTWLFGQTFTAADITLSVLLHRMIMLGMESRYFPAGTSPHTHRYLQQLLHDQAFMRIQKEIAGLRLTLLWEDIKSVAPYLIAVAGIGVTVGLTFWIIKHLR